MVEQGADIMVDIHGGNVNVLSQTILRRLLSLQIEVHKLQNLGNSEFWSCFFGLLEILHVSIFSP